MDTQTRVTEVAPGIHQLTTVIPDAPVAFNPDSSGDIGCGSLGDTFLCLG